jgi:hypothetical protein
MQIGMGGGAVVMGRTGGENSEAGLPSKRAIACSSWARAMPILWLADS